jgi:hypothetical protein
MDSLDILEALFRGNFSINSYNNSFPSHVSICSLRRCALLSTRDKIPHNTISILCPPDLPPIIPSKTKTIAEMAIDRRSCNEPENQWNR